MASNSLGEDGSGGHPIEPIEGSQIIGGKREKVFRIVAADGTVTEYPMKSSHSALAEDGTYVDSTVDNVVLDPAGNAYPSDPSKVLGCSHSGIAITNPEQLAHCSSWLHPPGRSTAICLDQDGRIRANGTAICNHCDQTQITVYLALIIVSIGVMLGIWQGAGVF